MSVNTVAALQNSSLNDSASQQADECDAERIVQSLMLTGGQRDFTEQRQTGRGYRVSQVLSSAMTEMFHVSKKSDINTADLAVNIDHWKMLVGKIDMRPIRSSDKC